MKRIAILIRLAAALFPLLVLGSPQARAQASCNASTLNRVYVSGGSNELMGDIAISCITSVSSVQTTLTASYSAPVTTGTGMMTSSLPFVVAPTRAQVGDSITFTFTPSAGTQSFVIFGVGVNATFAGSAVNASWSGSNFFFTNVFGQVGLATTESNLVAAGTKGRVDSTGGLSGVGSAQVLIPITAKMFSGVTSNSLSFQLRIIPNGTAPALSGTLAFNGSPSLPAPGVDTSGGANLITVTWGGGLSLTGTTPLGSVVMTIPGNVTSQHSYTLLVSQASSSAGTMYGGPTYILTTTAAPKFGRRQTISE